MARTHRIPTHLDEEEKLLWNLSTRQILALGVGLTFAFMASNSLTPITGPVVSTMALLGIIALTMALALVKTKHRPLDQWLVVWLIYHLQPRYYVWRPLPLETTDHEQQEEKKEKREEIEEW